MRAALYRKICDFKSLSVLFFIGQDVIEQLIMDMIEKLSVHEQWLRFLEYKKSGGHLSRAEQVQLEEFIKKKQYLPVAESLARGGVFSLPEAVKVNKQFSTKKRTVFVFPKSENYVQKMLAYLMLDFDSVFADNLYSFRKNMGAKKAITRIICSANIAEMYSYKLDISDYFGSVSVKRLLPRLHEVLEREERLFALLNAMLEEKRALCEGEVIEMEKGILAGCPLSGFFANLYLSELDRYFAEKGVLYARYSDDIIVFAPTREQLNAHKKFILQFLAKNELQLNADKEYYSAPHEEWTFLGFRYRGGTVDISEVSKRKLKKKMKRKARALLRWKKRKGASAEQAVRAYIRYFNRKLYDNPVNNELTWARWYFPIINTAESLKELDAFEQQCIRYLATETYSKKQFEFTYEQMKACGYVTLVNRFYE